MNLKETLLKGIQVILFGLIPIFLYSQILMPIPRNEGQVFKDTTLKEGYSNWNNFKYPYKQIKYDAEKFIEKGIIDSELSLLNSVSTSGDYSPAILVEEGGSIIINLNNSNSRKAFEKLLRQSNIFKRENPSNIVQVTEENYLKKENDAFKTLMQVGKIHFRKNNFGEARRKFRIILFEDSDNPEACYYLGEIDFILGKFHNSKKYFLKGKISFERRAYSEFSRKINSLFCEDSIMHNCVLGVSKCYLELGAQDSSLIALDNYFIPNYQDKNSGLMEAEIDFECNSIKNFIIHQFNQLRSYRPRKKQFLKYNNWVSKLSHLDFQFN